LDDLIVGAFNADPSGKSNAGKSYVVFGKANSSAIKLILEYVKSHVWL
jgi:hypothetical protein